ncbi:DUF2177 family protein [Asticcacaulis sp. EMRT-3]|uniref:DUF2177 family protein n=1 Tax=Asticcacaulis sp. EMRT-3 TaxID=3040349 RepID=UPI0024AF8D2E|nr:DUF2177 family protein [Asticcacaulis sp. EMRT-3]MDI7775854.1 DUF2177 family protein [Asticcacaulis sp. EMRT-3]
MRFALSLLLVLLVLLGLDFIWLGTTAETLYRPAMGALMRPDANLFAAAGFYLIYGFALHWLVIWPAIKTGAGLNRLDLTVRAGLFGLAAFSTYDLTGLAVITDWPHALSFIDMGWGTFAAVLTAHIVAMIMGLKRKA